MKAIRGATTVANDTPEEIRSAVEELLNEMKSRNGLEEENVIFILFSNTSDIQSLYPAKAARESGFAATALFSAAEPEIAGSLRLCIRVMMLVEGCYDVHPVYLRGAKILRKDFGKFSIALDGPSGSGKSTIAKRLAKDFDILYLDTGAMYRACALQVISHGFSVTDKENTRRQIDSMNLDIQYRDGAQHTILNGQDVSEEIRKPEVSMAASAVSAYGFVREKMVAMQRLIADKMSCVLDGRDIGSVVLPNATFKFYVTASVEVRTKRRYAELIAKGYDVNIHDLKKEIEERDKNDSTRAISPLCKAKDAIEIDTSDMDIDQVLSCIKKKIQEKI